jgi:hypothetical protein
VGTILSNQNDVVGRPIVGQDAMLSIVDPASWGEQRNLTDTILIGSLLVVADLYDLHVPEAEGQNEKRSNNDVTDKTDAPAKGLVFFTL